MENKTKENKSKTQLDLKEDKNCGIDQFLIQKRNHEEQYQHSIINKYTNLNMTFDESEKFDPLEEVKVEPSVEKKLADISTERNVLRIPPKTQKHETRNIITNRNDLIDKFMKNDRRIISRDVRNFTAIPTGRKEMNQTFDSRNNMTLNSSRPLYYEFQKPVIQRLITSRNTPKNKKKSSLIRKLNSKPQSRIKSK